MSEGTSRGALDLLLPGDTLTHPYGVFGLNGMITVEVVLFGLDLPEQRDQAFFEDGCGLPLI